MQIKLANSEILSDTKSDILGFNPFAEISICFLEVDSKILLLKRTNKTIENNTWGVPGGKLEFFETPIQALQRELKEETGLRINEIDQKACKHTLYARLLSIDCTLHIFQMKLSGSIKQYPIFIDKREHSEYIWVAPMDAFQLNLIRGEAEIIKLLYPTLFLSFCLS